MFIYAFDARHLRGQIVAVTVEAESLESATARAVNAISGDTTEWTLTLVSVIEV